MGQDYKIIRIPEGVISQIHSDLSSDGILVYPISKVPKVFIQKNLINPSVVEKSTCVIVALSANYGDKRNYMFLVAPRIDECNGILVTDLDPIVMVSDLSSASPSLHGVTRFHGNFLGRTEFLTSDLSLSTSTLQAQVSGKSLSFDSAPCRFVEAMHFMANEYNLKIK